MRRYHAVLLTTLAVVFIWSLVRPHDGFTWLLEAFPVIIGLPILLRQSPLKPGKWLAFVVLSICLAISALYEMLEWWVAVASGSDAVAFLATQGDVWDTHWDMFLCLLGAIASLALLSHRHDRSLTRLH